MPKTTDKKNDFIELISQMTDTELNDYIKIHGKPPKKVRMYHLIDKEKLSYEQSRIISDNKRVM